MTTMLSWLLSRQPVQLSVVFAASSEAPAVYLGAVVVFVRWTPKTKMSEEDKSLRTPNTSSAVDHKAAALSVARRLRSSYHPHYHLHHHLSSKHRYSRPQQQQQQQQQQRQVAGRRVCRKYRQVYIRSLQQQEYNKLLNIVPVLASSRHKKRIPKVTVIEETIRYIDQLHEALAERVENETGGRLKITTEEVAEAAKDMFVEDATSAAAAPAAGAIPASVCTSKCTVCENERSAPKTKSSCSTSCAYSTCNTDT